jgi:hypothetical protein
MATSTRLNYVAPAVRHGVPKTQADRRAHEQWLAKLVARHHERNPHLTVQQARKQVLTVAASAKSQRTEGD